MFDLRRTGNINIQEFAALFKYINDWKGLFERIDGDRSGYIEEPELRQGNQAQTQDKEHSRVSWSTQGLQNILVL